MNVHYAADTTRKANRAWPAPAEKIDKVTPSKQVAHLHMAQNALKQEASSSEIAGSLPEVAKSVLTHMRAVQDLIHSCNPETAKNLGLPRAMVGSTMSGESKEQLAQTLGLPEAMVHSVVPKDGSTRHASNMSEAELQVCEKRVSGLMNAALCGLPNEMLASTQEHPQALLDEVGNAIDICIGRLAELLGESPEGSPCNINERLHNSNDFMIEQLDAAGDLMQHSLQAQTGFSTEGAAALNALRTAKNLMMQKHLAKEASSPSLDETSSPVELEVPESSEGSVGDAPGDTLQQHLQLLESEDPLCVLSVRKINRLGFDSKAILERHFAWHGVATKVLVAHLKVKQAGHRPARSRPAGLGFVVMASREGARNVLHQGERQMIGDVEITVQPFQKPSKNVPN